MDRMEALEAAVNTAQPFEEDGAVVGVTLDLLREILAGRATHARVNSPDNVMRLKILRTAKKEGA